MTCAMWLIMRTAREAQSSNTTKAIYPTFPCVKENMDDDEPKKSKKGKLPWKQCVDPEYQTEHPYLVFPDAGHKFNILDPENCLPDEAFPTLLDRVMVGIEE
jgi:hypothetical protein